MFQVTIGSFVLIAFVWGPLVNRGIRKGTVPTGISRKGIERVTKGAATISQKLILIR